jgi:acetyltransferase-like isoleucine patch superfamily enzyme
MSLLDKIKKAILLHIEGIIRNVGGPFGIKIRRQYYKRRFAKCGVNVKIEEGVIISGPESIYIQDNVWIDKYCILMAGEIQGIDSRNINYRKQDAFSKKRGELHIGSNSHIGIRTIIQAHSGIEIGDYFTSSADCKIYSFSNNVKMCRHGTIGLHDVHFIDSPITIQNNVWLGLNCIVVGGKIGKNTFVMPNSIVISDIEDNSIAEGFPAKRIKKRIGS